MHDVLVAVVLLSIDEGLADVGPSGEYPHRTSLAVVHAGHGLLGVHVDQGHVGAGVRHSARDLHLLVVGQHVVAKGHHGQERNLWIWVEVKRLFYYLIIRRWHYFHFLTISKCSYWYVSSEFKRDRPENLEPKAFGGYGSVNLRAYKSNQMDP